MSYGNSGGFDGMNQPPKKSNSTLWWVLGIIGVISVGGALVCCGGIYFMVRFGTQVVGDQVKLAISADPVIQEHVGTISEINMNLTATGAAGGNNKIVFDVKGEKGSGQLEVVMDQTQGQEGIQACVLVLPNGDRHEIALTPPADATIPEVSDGEPSADAATETSATEESAAPSAEAADSAEAVESEALDTEPALN